MEKSILKKFATESRKLLMANVENQLNKYRVEEQFEKTISGDLIILKNDKYTLAPMTQEEYNCRERLIKRIKDLSDNNDIKTGIKRVIEESAYTWFNRIIAMRYMEVNDMLPLTKDNQSLNIRVLSSKDGIHPEILKMNNLTNSALDLNVDMKDYSKLSTENEQFNYVLKKVCNKLGKIIPPIFDGYTDYIDVLLPDNLLLNSGFVYKLLDEVPEDCFDTVEVIGWLYQYYNQDEKDRVINAKKVYKKNEIPYATQLFTPDWIVKYMVENSLGRYWVERNYSDIDNLSNNWKYFIKDNVEKINERVKPTEITFIDPCSGSGHILVYAFEVFMQIYKSAGYNTKDIPELILKNNLYGLDIDDRAGQLSILSVLLKAREYDQNIFNKDIIKDLNILSLQESKGIDTSFFDQSLITAANIDYLIDIFRDAKEIGSLLKVEKRDYSYAIEKLNDNILGLNLLEQIKPLVKQAKILSNKYTIVVTNPPYMNSSIMPPKLKEYLAQYYSDFKSDLFASFTIQNINLSIEKSYLGFIAPYVWMFIASYEKMRDFLYNNVQITSLVQLEYNAFEAACVPVAALTLCKSNEPCIGEYIQLAEFRGADNQAPKTLEAIKNRKCGYRYSANQENFKKIPGAPVAYWVSQPFYNLFENETISSFGDAVEGIKTGDNERFLRFWFEVSNKKEALLYNYDAAIHKWVFSTKGGNFRKWYGNIEYVMNWENDGSQIKAFKGSSFYKEKYLNKDAATWTYMTSSKVSFRYLGQGYFYNNKGPAVFTDDKETAILITAFMNTVVGGYIQNFLNPTLTILPGNIRSIPLIISLDKKEHIVRLAQENILISKEDWDSFETSWDFTRHPLLKPMSKVSTIRDSLNNWNNYTSEQRSLLKHNEEELNRLFIDIYGLNEELTPEVDEKDITIRNIDKLRDIKSYISYFVGCLFGRYSLDEDGLVFAGGQFDSSKYNTFKPDADNIIPITDTEYFKDDIVSKFKEFVKVTFGEETLNENLDYIADTLGRRGNESSEQVIRRYFANDFYKDHIQTYQKKPIYWLLDSGKKNGFKALFYMHRYDKDLISRVRLDYIGKVQTIYENRLKEIKNDLNSSLELSTYEVKQLEKEQNSLYEKLEEVKKYYVKLSTIGDKNIELDLDDGVTENYKLFSYVDPETNEESSILGEAKIIAPKKK